MIKGELGKYIYRYLTIKEIFNKIVFFFALFALFVFVCVVSCLRSIYRGAEGPDPIIERVLKTAPHLWMWLLGSP